MCKVFGIVLIVVGLATLPKAFLQDPINSPWPARRSGS